MALGPLGALAGIGLVVGKMIGDAIVDGQIKQLEARANEMADQVEKNGKIIADRLIDQSGKLRAWLRCTRTSRPAVGSWRRIEPRSIV